MLAQAYPSPADSRGSTPAASAAPGTSAAKRRKQHPLASAAAASASPAPEDPNGPAANVVLPARFDFFSRPRLTISRFPVFPAPDPSAAEPTYYQTEQLATNRIGYRYVPAGVAPPGSALPCRTIESAPPSFRVSWEDRSPFVRVTPDGLGLQGDKGYRSARCNAPVREGAWYLEILIVRGGGEFAPDPTAPAAPGVGVSAGAKPAEGSHVRLGWARREAPLNAPVGLDGYSYGVRDKTGEKVTLSRPRPYGRAFGSGDVVGMYISLPARRAPDPADADDPAHLKRERIAIEFKGQEYFESLEYAQTKEMAALMDYSGKSAGTASLPSAPTNKKSATTKNLPDRGRTSGGGGGDDKDDTGGGGGGGGSNSSGAPHLRALPTLPGSRIAFFINGECQGTAFRDLYDYLPLRAARTSGGKHSKAKESARKRPREGAPREHRENPFDDGTLGYYPFLSLFNHARVRINPGPDFHYPPPDDVDALLDRAERGSEPPPPVEGQRTWRPMCERYPEFMREQWALDEKEEAEAAAQARAVAAEEEERGRAEAHRQAQRDKRKAQAEARKRAKQQERAQEQEDQHASVSVSASASRAASLAVHNDLEQQQLDDRFGPSSSLLSAAAAHDLPSAAHSPAPTTADSDVNAIFQDAVVGDGGGGGGGYNSSEAGDAVPYYLTEGEGDTDAEAHGEDDPAGSAGPRARSQSHHSPRTHGQDIDMDLEELI